MLRVILLGMLTTLLLALAACSGSAPAANQQPAPSSEGMPEVTVYKSPT